MNSEQKIAQELPTSCQGMPLGDFFAEQARLRENKIAITAPDGDVTWGEFNRQANRLAHALAAKGVGRGDFVTLALCNKAVSVATSVACWKIGATPQLVSWRSTPTELRAFVDLAQSAALVVDDDVADASTSLGALTPSQLLASTSDDSDLPTVIAPSIKAPASGGSTGRPKLIVSTRQGVIDYEGARLYGLNEDTVMLLPAPLYHNGPFSAALSAMAVGARVVLMSKFDAEETLRLIERERATWLYAVPTMMNRIWRLSEEVRQGYDLSSLQSVWHMAAPCPQWLKQAWIDWLGPDHIFELYGGTEGQAFTTLSGTQWLQHRGSVGKVYFGEVCILDAEGRSVPPGMIGEIYLRPSEGAGPTYRYIGAESKSQGDWDTLGDMGWMDADGYLYIADRQTDMILVGGINIYPAEIESAIEEHPLVQSCAVIGLPDDDLGNVIHAIVQPKDGLDIEQLKLHLAERLSPQKRPRTFELVQDPVRDDAGKVRRSGLRAERLTGAS